MSEAPATSTSPATDAHPREYDRHFYNKEQDASLRSARIIAPYVYELLRPKSVVDVGCGVGGWLLAFRELGAERVLGYDGDWVKPDMLRIAPADFRVHNISEPIHPEQTFDLAITVEAAEHLPPEKARTFVQSMTGLAPVVLFSAAIPGQEGRNHVNEQWPGYWVELFRERGYAAIDCLRARFWNDAEVRWWYKQNLLLMVSEDRLAGDAVLSALRKQSAQVLPLVHPELFEEKWHKLQDARQKADRPTPSIRSGLRELRRGIRNALRRIAGKPPRK